MAAAEVVGPGHGRPVAAWKARRVAEQTRSLPAEGAAFVDTHLAPVLTHCTWVQIERTVEEARVRFAPAEAEVRRRAAAEIRHFDVDLSHVTYDGVARVEGDLDLADATLVAEAVAAGAAELAGLGSTESLDVRRSQALGLMARKALTGQGTLDLTGADLTIYVHLATDPAEPQGLDPVAHVEHTGSVVAVDQVRSWCQAAGTRVTIRPVIDLNANLHTDSYEPTEVQKEQAVLTNPICIHPGCGRPARRADLDHIVEYDRGGPTDTVNLAPLCRGHRRLKTHTDWTVRRTAPTRFEWTSPDGRTYPSELARPDYRRRAS